MLCSDWASTFATQVLEEEAADKAASEKKFPDFRPGDILELKLVRVCGAGNHSVGIAIVNAPSNFVAFQDVAAAAWTSQNSRGTGGLMCNVVCQAVPQNKGRPATVKGLCIAKKNRGWRTSFTVLNFIQGGGPVERTFPLCALPHSQSPLS